MKNQYGYGPVRGLVGLRLKKHLSTVLNESALGSLAPDLGGVLSDIDLALYNALVLLYPGCFDDIDGLHGAISDLRDKAAELANAKSQMETLGAMWTGMLASGAPFACTPHAASGNLTSDLIDLTSWITALKFPAGDGIRIASGDV